MTKTTWFSFGGVMLIASLVTLFVSFEAAGFFFGTAIFAFAVDSVLEKLEEK